MSTSPALFEKIKRKLKPKAKCNCQNAPGDLVIYVARSDTQKPVANARVRATGPTPGSSSTDIEGLAILRDRAPGAYKAEVSLPPLLSKFRLNSAAQSGAVVSEKAEVLEFEASPPPVLKVKVLSRKEKAGKLVEQVLSDVQVEVRGPAFYAGVTTKDWYSFRDVDPGHYHVSVKSLGVHGNNHALPEVVKVALGLGETKEILLVAPALGSLRVVLVDKDERPIKDASWSLDSPVAASGSTTADGLIKIQRVPLSQGAGKLKIRYPRPPAAAKPAAAPPAAANPNAPPPYPPKIVFKDFKDKDPVPPEANPSSVDWILKIGLQRDYADDGGVKDRLWNLGFNCRRSSDAAATARAVKAYQRAHMKNPNGSGALADAKDHIKNYHDNP